MVTKVKGGVLDESALSGKNMTGDIAFDTSTLKIDSSNNRVGIGTASPSSLLHLGGATNKGIEITSSTSNAGYLGVYQNQAIFSINRDGADGSFADTGKAAAVIKMHSADADSKIELQTTTSNNAEPTTRMTILKNGDVGIGTTSPTNNLHIHTDSGDEGLTIKSTGNTSNAIIFDANRSGSGSSIGEMQSKWNGTTVAMIASITGSDTTNKDDGAIVFYTSSANNLAERARILPSGGLTFNGDTASANALDDYEEGTFTPLFYGSSSGTANNDGGGHYTKIGRQVTIHVDVYNKAFGTYSGDLRMQLPFTNAGTGIPSSAGDIYFYPSGNWDGVSNFAGIGVRCYSTSYLNFALIQLDSDRQTYIGSSNTSTSNSSGNFLRFSFTYVAA